MHGNGMYQFADGRMYTGQWWIGHMSGEGKLSWPDGRAYAGQWLQGKRHGTGTVTEATGAQVQGEWDTGKQVSSSRDKDGPVDTRSKPSNMSAATTVLILDGQSMATPPSQKSELTSPPPESGASDRSVSPVWRSSVPESSSQSAPTAARSAGRGFGKGGRGGRKV